MPRRQRLNTAPVQGDGVFATLEGAQELTLLLQEVSDDMQLKGGRAALRKAGQVIETRLFNEAYKLDRESTANAMWKNVVIRWAGKAFKARGDLQFRIGFLGGALTRERNEANPGGDTFYWRFLEFGTEKMRARPFVRTALEQSQSKVVSVFIGEYKKRLESAIRRGKRKGGG